MVMKIFSGGSSITIDGKSFNGKNVSIVNGKVIVDGVTQDGELTGDINVVVHGDIDRLENSCGTVTAKAVGSISTQSGDVICEGVNGSVSTMSGDVRCTAISGSVSTMSGDVSRNFR